MGFDHKQDALQKEETNRRILDAGFSMFSKMSIDKVSMENVADEAGIGIATLYRYYRTKSELVVAVGTHVWSNFIIDYMPIRNEDNTTASEELEFFLDSFLELYKNHKKLLCFNQFFNIYIRNEAISKTALNSYNEMVDQLAMRFHKLLLLIMLQLELIQCFYLSCILCLLLLQDTQWDLLMKRTSSRIMSLFYLRICSCMNSVEKNNGVYEGGI